MPVQLLLNTSIQPDPSVIPALQPLAQIARNELYQLGVEMVQYGKTADGNVSLLRYNIFDPAYPAFHFAAWALVYDWATAYREVIEFQGDIGHWIDHNLYYIDPASAAINGLLSLRVKNVFYIFDVKIWRFFSIEESDSTRSRLERD
ncbi:unnamed protein product, partial [Aphanomyces euteiches]